MYSNRFSVRRMCKILRASPSGYYRWLKSPMRDREKIENALLKAIEQVFLSSKRTYGSPRITKELQARNIKCGRHKVAKIMRFNGIKAKAKRKFNRRENAKQTSHMIAPDLVQRKFNPSAINRIWAADMTHIRTREGWTYLSVIMDLCSRRIISWGMSNKQNTVLTKKVLLNALRTRQPDQGLIHHSDRGSQYANHEYQSVLNKLKIKISMGNRKTCYDNAVVESFFHTIKMEHLYWLKLKTRKEAFSAVFNFIERFYNPKRRHSTLNYLSPIDFERGKIVS